MLGLAFNASSATIEQEVQNVIDDTQIRQESICDAALFRLPCLSCTYNKELKNFVNGTISSFTLAASSDCIYSSRRSTGTTVHG